MQTELNRATQATRLIFVIHGTVLAAWAPLIPIVRDKLAIDEAALGFLLLCIGIGGLLSMPFMGTACAIYGYRKVIIGMFIAAALTLPLLSQIDNYWLMALALTFFGATIGGSDVSMNLHAAAVESDLNRPIMSNFHGMWSLGTFIGVTMTSLLLSFHAPVLLASLLVSVVSIIIALILRNGLYAKQTKLSDAPLFVMPKGIIIYLGLICFFLYLVEHAILDWSAVFLNTVKNVAVERAGFGFSCFSLAMIIGRFSGDNIRAKLNDEIMILAGGILASFGYGLFAFAPILWLNFAGLFIIGLGISNLVPIFFSLAGRTKVMPSHLALTAVATVSHAGILMGPALIGFLAIQIGLSKSFAFLSILLLFIAANYRLPKLLLR